MSDLFGAVGPPIIPPGQLLETMSPEIPAEREISAKYVALKGAPGGKVGGLEPSQRGRGFFQRYDNGAIYWRRDLGTFWVLGAIYQKYLGRGAAPGFLGHPVTDETPTGDGVGRFTDFEGGSVYWHPSIGVAFEVHGAIRECWRQHGSESYGYPITDETVPHLTSGRFNHFRRFNADGSTPEGSIYWSPSTGEAHTVDGAIRARWFELGDAGESYLGFPVTDEMDWTDPDTGEPGRVSHFERGAIARIAADGSVVEFPARRVFRSGHIGVSSVGGWVELTLTSAGTFHYRGHLHNSGFIGMSCSVGSVVKIPGTDIAFGAPHDASVGGTLFFDSRDEDWQDDGFNHQIRTFWNALANADSMRTKIDVGVAGGDVFLIALLPLVGAAVLISLLTGPHAPADTKCQTTGGGHTVKDGNNNTIREPDGVRCRPH
jgi:hypothetical protein